VTRLRSLAWLAELLDVPPGTVRSMASRGQIPVVRLGPRIVRVDEDEIRAWIDARRVEAAPGDELARRRGAR
jgi:excisionase family DNA binding protein